MSDLEARRASVPFVDLSRCPITGEVLRRSLEVRGLDGRWWNNRNPVRPVEPRCRTLFAFTGAMGLDEDLEVTTWLVKPGPGVPFVIPRILSHEGVAAVLSSVTIGRHTGWVIAYYAEPPPGDLRGANEWGLETYRVVLPDGRSGWDRSDDIVDDYDFDLGPWIERGDLFWIPPGDPDLTLRRGLPKCPYLGLQGVREIQRIQEGELWYPGLAKDPGDDPLAP